MPAQWDNPEDAVLRSALVSARRVAVVGLSDRPTRPSYGVAQYLVRQGYEIIPVNPNHSTWLGRRAYPRLRDVPGSIDIVDVFRRPEAVDDLIDDVAVIQAPMLWLQEGVVNVSAASRARERGIAVVMDRCILMEHARLMR